MYVFRAFLCLVVFAECVRESSPESGGGGPHDRSLSRRKRFLIFPEGSSLQLIFCWVVPIVGMPNIFTMGLTAAVAWQLPTKPEDIFMKKHLANSDTRRIDKPDLKMSTKVWTKPPPSSYVKYNKIYSKNPPRTSISSANRNPLYQAMMWSSPAFRDNLKRKYGINWRSSQTRGQYSGFDDGGKDDDSSYYYRSPMYDEVHRRTRRDLYEKMEKVLTSKQLDGKACLLKFICTMSKGPADELGPFWEEILKTIFRIRSSRYTESDDYDQASNKESNCTEMYPTCSLY